MVFLAEPYLTLRRAIASLVSICPVPAVFGSVPEGEREDEVVDRLCSPHCFQSIVLFHDLLEIVVVFLSNFFDLERGSRWRIRSFLNRRILSTASRVFIAACSINSSIVRCIRSCSTRLCSTDWSAVPDRTGRAYCCCCCSWSSDSANFSCKARLDDRGDPSISNETIENLLLLS